MCRGVLAAKKGQKCVGPVCILTDARVDYEEIRLNPRGPTSQSGSCLGNQGHLCWQVAIFTASVLQRLRMTKTVGTMQ